MSLLDDVSIVVTPNGYKAGTLYGVIPVPTEGAELVVNGDFATTSWWSVGTYWAITGNGLATRTVVGSQTNYSVSRASALTVGMFYKVVLIIDSITSGNVKIVLGATNGDEYTEAGTYIFTGVCSTNQTFKISPSDDFNGSISNVSVKEYTSSDMDVTRATAATRVDENGLVNYAEVLGGELVTNGDYTNGLTGWNTQIPSGQIVEVTSNQLHINYDSSQTQGSTGVYQSILTLTKTYKTTIDVASVTGTFKVQVGNVVHTITTAGIKTFINVASDAELFIVRKSNGQSFEARINSVSVKEVTRDNVPRIDYTGGGCPHILAEPQRTNLITYSEDFSQSVWVKESGGTGDNPIVTSNIGISPDGTQNADKIVFDLNGGTSSSDLSQLRFSLSSFSGDYTNSIYLKSFDGASYNVSILDTNGIVYAATITNEWQRFEYYNGGGTTSVNPFRIRLRGNESTSDNAALLIYGAQIEQGSYPTSYIPTSGSTVTRNQDQFTRDGIGSLINDSEGVLFVESSVLSNDGTYKAFSLSDGTTSNTIRFYTTPTLNQLAIRVTVAGVHQFNVVYTLTDLTVLNKMALKYKSNDFAFWVNGVEVKTSTSGNTYTANTLNSLQFDRGDGVDTFFGKVKQLQVYDTALTDMQLIQLTGTAGTDFYESYSEMAESLTYTIQ